MTIEIPFEQPPSKAAVASHAETTVDKSSVLLIDDEPLIRKTLARMLKSLGFRPEVASSWAEVEAQVQQRQFQVVLMDLRMKEMDGFEMLRELKNSAYQQTGSILAMTGDATEDRRQQAAEAGFDGFIAKPITVASLKEACKCRTLDKHIDNTTSD